MNDKYYKNDDGKLFRNPSNTKNLTKLTKVDFEAELKLKKNPPKTYSQELAELNSPYLTSKESIGKAILGAISWDGINETPTVERLRLRGASLDATYSLDLSELKTKWGK